MTDETDKNQEDITAPPGDNPAEATSPPGNGEVDDQAVKEGEEKLGEAGAGH